MSVKFIVTATNESTAGWLAYILGLDRPEDEWGADGWDMGQETPSLDSVRYVMERQRSLDAPQYIAARVIE